MLYFSDIGKNSQPWELKLQPGVARVAGAISNHCAKTRLI